jgi:hypothetical protein
MSETKLNMNSAETRALFGGDISKPSLATLSAALRHPETWPKGFYWNYNECHTCAHGLALALWTGTMEDVDDLNISNNAYIDDAYLNAVASIMAKTFAMPYKDAERIFIESGGRKIRKYLFLTRRDRDITPEMVADDIDAFLAERK